MSNFTPAIFFDLDGLFVNTKKLKFHAWENAVLQLSGKRLDINHYLEIQDKTQIETAYYFCEMDYVRSVSVNSLIHIMKKNYAVYLGASGTISENISGLELIYGKLSRQSLTCGLSIDSKDDILPILDKPATSMRLGSYFDVIATLDDLQESARDARLLYLSICDKFNQNPSECVSIETTARGVIAAKESGIQRILAIQNPYTIGQIEALDAKYQPFAILNDLSKLSLDNFVL